MGWLATCPDRAENSDLRTLSILRPRSIVSSDKELKIDVSTWNGADLVRSSDYGSVLFTEKARDWFTERWSEYVGFDEFPTT